MDVSSSFWIEEEEDVGMEWEEPPPPFSPSGHKEGSSAKGWGRYVIAAAASLAS